MTTIVETWSGQGLATSVGGAGFTGRHFFDPQAVHTAHIPVAHLTNHDGLVTLQDPFTGIFGSGADETAALLDYRAALDEHLDVLSRQERLTPGLAAQLAYLRDVLS